MHRSSELALFLKRTKLVFQPAIHTNYHQLYYTSSIIYTKKTIIVVGFSVVRFYSSSTSTSANATAATLPFEKAMLPGNILNKMKKFFHHFMGTVVLFSCKTQLTIIYNSSVRISICVCMYRPRF